MTATVASLQHQAHQIKALPRPAQAVVEAYQNMRVQGAVAACPYHINPGLRSTNRALLGKGRPEEIQATAEACFRRYAMHVPPGDAAELRVALKACGLGVDCSGFASWVLNAVTQHTLGRPIWSCVTAPGLRRRVVMRVRTVQNISAHLLTSHLNAQPITDLAQLQPGNLLRLAGGHHVVVITEVGYDSDGATTYFQYAQSSCQYGVDDGVRTGFCIITAPHAPLAAQDWHDNADPHIMQGLIAENEADNRAVRLKALAGAVA